MLRERIVLAVNAFVEIVIWRVPNPVVGSEHLYKYRLAYVVDQECVVRYDNEAGKGDHRHVRGEEVACRFTRPERLLRDFWQMIDRERGP